MLASNAARQEKLPCGICEDFCLKLICRECSRKGIRLERTALISAIATSDRARGAIEKRLEHRASLRAIEIQCGTLRNRNAAIKTEKARLALSLAKDKLRITNLRSQISCRRKTLVEMQNQEDNAHRNLLSNIKSETSLIQDKINTTQRSIIAQQLTMCRTLTQFYNLRPTPPSVSDTSSYSLFNFLIPNLMAYLHTFSHEELITSLETFCRFLVQVSTYLNILLPNTIHLPTEGRSIIVLERFQNPGLSVYLGVPFYFGN